MGRIFIARNTGYQAHAASMRKTVAQQLLAGQRPPDSVKNTAATDVAAAGFVPELVNRSEGHSPAKLERARAQRLRVRLAETGYVTECSTADRRVGVVEEWVVEQVNRINASLELGFTPDVKDFVETRVELRVARSAELVAAGVGQYGCSRRFSRAGKCRRVEPRLATRNVGDTRCPLVAALPLISAVRVRRAKAGGEPADGVTVCADGEREAAVMAELPVRLPPADNIAG